MTLQKEFLKGLWRENPTFRLVLGMCPTLAVTTSAINGIGMGLATAFVLVCSNIVISILRRFIPSKVRIPAFIVIIASFVTLVDLMMEGYFFSLHKALGLYIPLITVNCIILGRAEAFASKNSLIPSIADGLGMGIGFTLSLTVLGMVRELIGRGTFFGVSIFGSHFPALLVFVLPPGAYLALGLLSALMNRISLREKT